MNINEINPGDILYCASYCYNKDRFVEVVKVNQESNRVEVATLLGPRFKIYKTPAAQRQTSWIPSQYLDRPEEKIEEAIEHVSNQLTTLQQLQATCIANENSPL